MEGFKWFLVLHNRNASFQNVGLCGLTAEGQRRTHRDGEVVLLLLPGGLLVEFPASGARSFTYQALTPVEQGTLLRRLGEVSPGRLWVVEWPIRSGVQAASTSCS